MSSEWETWSLISTATNIKNKLVVLTGWSIHKHSGEINKYITFNRKFFFLKEDRSAKLRVKFQLCIQFYSNFMAVLQQTWKWI